MDAGTNHNDQYCGEVSDTLYRYAADQAKVGGDAEKSTYTNCAELLRTGELDRLGCCVTTFTTTLKDMNSTAFTMWEMIRRECRLEFESIAHTCPLLGDTSAAPRGAAVGPATLALSATLALALR